MPIPSVSIVIPSFNEGAWLERTVRACLENTDYPNFDIVVVADGCTDDSVAGLRSKKFPNLTILELDHSCGAIEARNRGGEAAQGQVLVFIDSHQEPLSENWLQVLVKTLAKPSCGAATIPITALNEKDRIGFLYSLKDWTLEPTWRHPQHDGASQLTGAIPGGCFAISKKLFAQTGGFNASLKKWGREDFEYSLRLWRLGYDLWFCADGVMGHAFDHKRAFEISWQQVDYNSLWVANTLMDESAKAEVSQAIRALRPKTFTKVQTALKASGVEKAATLLSAQCRRSFADYKAQFFDF